MRRRGVLLGRGGVACFGCSIGPHGAAPSVPSVLGFRLAPCPFPFPPPVPATISSVMRGSCYHRLGFSPYRSPPRIFDKIGGVMIASAWLACLLVYERAERLCEAGGDCFLLSNPSDSGGRGGLACRLFRHHLSLFASSPLPFFFPFYLSRPAHSLRALLRSACVPCFPARRVGGRAGCVVGLLLLRAGWRSVDFLPVCGVCVGCVLACVLGRGGRGMLYI